MAQLTPFLTIFNKSSKPSDPEGGAEGDQLELEIRGKEGGRAGDGERKRGKGMKSAEVGGRGGERNVRRREEGGE